MMGGGRGSLSSSEESPTSSAQENAVNKKVPLRQARSNHLRRKNCRPTSNDDDDDDDYDDAVDDGGLIKSLPETYDDHDGTDNNDDDDLAEWEAATASTTKTAWSTITAAAATSTSTSSLITGPPTATSRSNRLQRGFRGVFGGGGGDAGLGTVRGDKTKRHLKSTNSSSSVGASGSSHTNALSFRPKVKPFPFGSLSSHRTKSLTHVDECTSTTAEEDAEEAFRLEMESFPDIRQNRHQRASTEDWASSSSSDFFKSDSSLATSATALSTSSRRLFHRSNSLTITSSSSSSTSSSSSVTLGSLGRSHTHPTYPPSHQRRFSLAAGSARDTRRESSTSRSNEDAFFLADCGELGGTGADGEESALNIPRLPERAVKKHRARRNSIQGSVAPLSDSSSLHKSFSHLARSAEEWKRSVLLEGSSPSEKGTGSGGSGSNDFGASELSSPAQSVASTRRKRNMDDGSSPSDFDDLLSLSQNSSSSRSARLTTRSRSSLCSPVGGLSASVATVLPFTSDPLVLPSLTTTGLAGGGRQSPYDDAIIGEGRACAMDIDDSDSDDGDRDDDDDDSRDGSPDNSFDICTSGGHGRRNPSSGSVVIKDTHKRSIETEQDVLDTMSSYDDLKFLTASLSKESKKGNHVMFGAEGWKVVPKTNWTPARRSAFFQWTTLYFGFSVRAAGGSVNFLQISKACGAKILGILQGAIALYKQQQDQKNEGVQEALIAPESAVSNRDSPVIFMDSGKYSARKARTVEADRSFLHQRLSAPHMPEPFSGSDLVDQMEMLDITAEHNALTRESLGGRSSLSSVGRHSVASMRDCRLSLETVATSRSSLGHHFSSNDLMMHLHGQSPVVCNDRPPILSKALLLSAGTYRSTATRLSAPLAAAPSFDIVET